MSKHIVEKIDMVKKKVQKWSRRKKITWIILGIILVLLSIALWKVNAIKNMIAPEKSILGSLTKKIPGSDTDLRGENSGRINVAVMGMRGIGAEGGGLLADTIMVVSLIKNTDANINNPYKISMLSIPRDLLVEGPDGSLSKINAVLFKGEKKQLGGGIDAMKDVLAKVVGQPVHYGVSVNFEGFSQTVDALGGVEVSLDKKFIEPLQFNEVHVCDGDKGGVFKVPTGETQKKYGKNGKITAEYPLCFNSSPECGGVFEVPAGKNMLTGEEALCYVRSRVTSSDFDRARRQQEVMASLRDKVSTMNVITDFTKFEQILKIVGENVNYDMEIWELQKFFDLYKESNDTEIVRGVLDDSAGGLLYAPNDANDEFGGEFGYILRPVGDDFTRIHEFFARMGSEDATTNQ